MSGELDEVITYDEPHFGLTVPATCPGVPDAILHPQQTWADPQAYVATAQDLAKRFRDNFAKYAANVEPEVLATQPR
jgi:phosphoenolpyruvate carboxykinase (ATP)